MPIPYNEIRRRSRKRKKNRENKPFISNNLSEEYFDNYFKNYYNLKLKECVKDTFSLSCYILLKNKYNIDILKFPFMKIEKNDTQIQKEKLIEQNNRYDIYIFFNTLICCILNTKIQSEEYYSYANDKFNHYKKYLYKEVFFLNKESDNDILKIFYECQTLYFKMIKFKQLLMYKTSKKYDYDEDFRSNKLSSMKKNYLFEIIENKTRYLFSIKDLVNIIENSLSSCEFGLVHHPVYPKNPFTNIEFSLSNLFNLYFKVKNTYLKMPILFHHFFLCHFNLKVFGIECDVLIREQSIIRYLKNLNEDEYYDNIMKLLKFVKTKFKINIYANIEENFPKDILVSALKPYYHIYIHYTNGLNKYKIELFKNKFKKYITAFYNYNKCFGRRIMFKEGNNYKSKYITNYLNFNNVKEYLKEKEINEEINDYYEPDTIQQSTYQPITSMPTSIERDITYNNEITNRNIENSHQLITIALNGGPFHSYVRNFRNDDERISFGNYITNITYTDDFQNLSSQESRNRINEIINRYNENQINTPENSDDDDDGINVILRNQDDVPVQENENDDNVTIINYENLYQGEQEDDDDNNDDDNDYNDDDNDDNDDDDDDDNNRDLYYDSDGFTR